MVDLVYIIGRTSKYDNAELRYALRSVEKHCTGFKNIFIVGYKPDFLNDNVIFIPCPDIDPAARKHKNITRCVLELLKDKRLLVNFIRMSDDEFYVKDTNMNNVPLYIGKGNLPDEVIDNDGAFDYHMSLKETRELLEKYDLPIFNFAQHTGTLFSRPILRANQKLFLESLETPHGCEPTVLMNSLMMDTQNVELSKREDLKIVRFSNEETLLNTIGDRNSFSIADSAVRYGLFNVLDKWFPEKSKYEI